jgi:hypothetical protein
LAKAGDGGVFGGTILVTAGESSQYIGGSLLTRTADQNLLGKSGSISLSSPLASGGSGSISFANLKSAISSSSKDMIFRAGQASSIGGSLKIAAGSIMSEKEAGQIIASAGSSETGNAGSIFVYSGTGALSSGSVEIHSGRSVSGTSGSIFSVGQSVAMRSGNSEQPSGAIGLIVGASSTVGGSIRIRSGISASNTGGKLTLVSGSSEISSSGRISLKSSSGVFRSGSVLLRTEAGVSGSGYARLVSGESLSDQGGNVVFRSNNNITVTATADSANIELTAASGLSSGGKILVESGHGDSQNAGAVSIMSGYSQSAHGVSIFGVMTTASSTSGSIQVSSNQSMFNSGNLEIRGGYSSMAGSSLLFSGGASGTELEGSSVTLSAGSSETMPGGGILLSGGGSEQDGGDVSLQTDTAKSSGAITVTTGGKGETGHINLGESDKTNLFTGNSVEASAGPIRVEAGSSSDFNGGSVIFVSGAGTPSGTSTIKGGNSEAGFDAGQISLISGNSMTQHTGMINLATGHTIGGPNTGSLSISGGLTVSGTPSSVNFIAEASKLRGGHIMLSSGAGAEKKRTSDIRNHTRS